MLIIISIFYSIIFVKIIFVNNFRRKLLYFYINLLYISFFSFYYSLEGFAFLLLLTELLIILLFTLIFLTIQFTVKNILNINKLVHNILIAIILLIVCYNYSKKFNIQYLNIINLVPLNISSDFFIFFYFLFIEYLPTIYFLAFILTIFSLFFIIIFFFFKLLQNNVNTNKKTIYNLRKQHLFKQTNYKPQYTTFQLNVSKKFLLNTKWFKWCSVS